MPEAFSLLMPVWDGDRPDYFARAFRSAVHDQTLPPDHVVVVRDGPVNEELGTVVHELISTCPSPVTVVAIEENVGLGPALNAGLRECWFDVVARMDADDVAMPHRFEVQLPLMHQADIAGSGMLEFGTDTDDIVGKRTPPLDETQIRAYARRHDPFNHPTVVYRRHAVLAAGGYGDLPLMEDYALFARMLDNGARAMNVADPLVFYRVGPAAESFRRRGGVALLRSELRLQRDLRAARFTTRREYLRNVIVRGGYRLVPWWARRIIYRALVGLYTEKLHSELNAALPPEPELLDDFDYWTLETSERTAWPVGA